MNADVFNKVQMREREDYCDMPNEDCYIVEGDEKINFKSISCERIPELFLDKLVAKKHFSKYGKINRFILRPNRLCCTVEYENESDAMNAYENAGNFNGYEFVINYSQKEVGHVQNTEEWVDPDVQSELDAMGNRSNSAVTSQLRQSLSRPYIISQRIIKPTTKPMKSMPSEPDIIEQTSIPKVDAQIRVELEAILRKPAFNDEEKFRVLDARDKLIRLTTIRQTDIKKAVSAKGTCPDMCPEKERLMREFQRQVSCFEMTNMNSSGTIDHRRAIKEYSRSSADQEVPLSHELRPENVLQMTMDYLMRFIMDLCDDPLTSMADWFHFVWDRTRSIRKDITQQELCSLGSVQLVEQCARFHIHCSARLVAEDPSVFDKKINAENLTKCLQTLKYMYHDLRIKNIRCPCEAEFRGYIVLLNLGDSNFLWELKQLPQDIQQSQHIKRAIAFYNALQNNNYVRFFNMIREEETHYFSACILLGYFTKLRLKAMEAIVKSYTWRKHPSWLPLDYLTQILGFENEDAAIDFFCAHGLECREVRVKLDRLQMPDLEYSMDRAISLVENKRKCSVGESICGQPFDKTYAFESHQPHNSFDSNGFLKPEAWKANDQSRGEGVATKEVKCLQQSQSQQAFNFFSPQQKQLPPSTCTSENIFKVPMAVSPISQKQLHQKQPQSSAKELAHRHLSQDSIVNDASKKINSVSQPKETETNSSGISIFKTPFASGFLQKSGYVSSTTTTNHFPSIFSSQSTFAHSIDTFKTEQTKQSSSDNIFGIAAKETASMFQQKKNDPQPLRTDNIFKHFQTTTSVFGAPIESKCNIFSANTEEINSAAKQSSGLASFADNSNKIVEENRQLEEQRRQKLVELEEERNQLRILEEKQQARLREAAERKARLKVFHIKSDAQCDAIFGELLQEEVAKIAVMELEKFSVLEQYALRLVRDIIDEFVLEQVHVILNEEFRLMCHDQMLLQRYFQRWLAVTRKKLAQRKLMEDTPIWVSSATRAEHAQQLQHPKQGENLREIQRYRLGQPTDFKLLRNVFSADDNDNLPPIDLFQILAKHYTPKHSIRNGITLKRRYYKLLLSLPGDHDEMHGFESISNCWLRKYILQPQRESPNGDTCFINNMDSDVALCVRKLTGFPPTNEIGQSLRDSESCNADAVICLMTGDNLNNTRLRLHHLLKLPKQCKPLPIGLIVYNAHNTSEHKMTMKLELENLIKEGRVSNYEFFGCQETKNSFSFYKNFKRCVSFVARESSLNSDESEYLEMQTLEYCIDAVLGETMWQRWLHTSSQNPIFNKICCIPRFVVALYNEAVERVKDILGENMQEAPEFPEELRRFVPPLKRDIPQGLEHFPHDWKSSQREKRLKSFLNNIKLPTLKDKQFILESSIEDLELSLLNYAFQCVPTSEAAAKGAHEAIKCLVESLNNIQGYDLSQQLAITNWLSVIKPLAFSRINQVLNKIKNILPEEIIYRRSLFYDYQQNPWWLNFKPLNLVTLDNTMSKSADDDQRASCDTSQVFEQIIEQAEVASQKAEANLIVLEQKASRLLNNELMQKMDHSFYQFELAQKCGQFNNTPPTDDSIDADEFDQVCSENSWCENNKSPQRKRKRKHDEAISETDSIIAKAFALIKRVENKEDHLRAKKSFLCSLDP